MESKFYRAKLILTGMLISLAVVFLLEYLLTAFRFPTTQRELTNAVEHPYTVAFQEMDGVWVVIIESEEHSMYTLFIYQPSVFFNRYAPRPVLDFDGAISGGALGRNFSMQVDIVGRQIEMQPGETFNTVQLYLLERLAWFLPAIFLIARLYYRWALKRKKKLEAITDIE